MIEGSWVKWAGFALTLALASCQASPRRPAVRSVPRLTLTDVEGIPHHLGDPGRKRPLVLVFWQPWCAPCQEEAPHLAEAARRLGDRCDFFGVVSGEDEYVEDQQVRTFQIEHALPYPQLRDRRLELTHALGVESTPTVIVFATDGSELQRGPEVPDLDRLAFPRESP